LGGEDGRGGEGRGGPLLYSDLGEMEIILCPVGAQQKILEGSLYSSILIIKIYLC